MVTTANLAIESLAPGGPDPEPNEVVTAATIYNAFIERMDIVLQGSVLDRKAAPGGGDDTDGNRYIISGTPTGDWSTFADEDVVYYYGGWIALTPNPGWVFCVLDENLWYRHNGTQWDAMGIGPQASTYTELTATFGTASDTVEDVGASYSQSGLNDIYRTLAAKVNRIRTILRDMNAVA